jgi:hypothetical protein
VALGYDSTGKSIKGCGFELLEFAAPKGCGMLVLDFMRAK